MDPKGLFEVLPDAARTRILCAARGKRVLLPESGEERIAEAARILRGAFGVDAFLPSAGECASRAPEVAETLRVAALRRGKEPSRITDEMASDPFSFGGALLARGEVDAVVGGVSVPTAHVIRAALGTVGLAPGVNLITSAFLMALATPTAGGEGVLVYADGAVVPQPTSAQLVDIAALAARAYTGWIGSDPRVAFLSFSTSGSASHADVSKVRGAFEAFRRTHPEISADGEIQFDAATVPAIAARKCPGSPVAGRANVMVFPDLDAGNIGYKMTQRLAGADAYGPVLLGSARPFSDLSRGATALDVVASSLLTLALA